jgi:hypothetical protein
MQRAWDRGASLKAAQQISSTLPPVMSQQFCHSPVASSVVSSGMPTPTMSPNLMSGQHQLQQTLPDQGRCFAICQGRSQPSPQVRSQGGFWLNDEQMAEQLRAAADVLYED